MKKYLKSCFIAIGCFFAAVLFLVILFALPWIIASVSGHIERQQMRNEIFEHVLQHKDILEPALSTREEFEYASTGFWDASTEYGYYYSEDDSYEYAAENHYRKGYRFDGVYGDPADWLYIEKICDKWYYYEYHDG